MQMKLEKKRITVILYRIIMLITLLTMTASLILFFSRKDKSLELILHEIMLCVVAMICLSIPIFLEKKFKMFIPNYILIMLFLFIFAHFILGEIYRVYDYSRLYDKILHTTSGIITAMLSYSIVGILNEYPKNKIKLSPFFLSIFAFCFTMTMEYLWEIFEYTVDSINSGNMQRWQDSLLDKTLTPNVSESGEYVHTDARGSGLNDTMMDMIVNIFGALAVSIYGYIGMKLKPESWIIDKIILTDDSISAIKAKNPDFEVQRKVVRKKKPTPLLLSRIKRVQNRYMIVSQKAERIYLKEIGENRRKSIASLAAKKPQINDSKE